MTTILTHNAIETAPRERLEALQLARLRSTLERRGLDPRIGSLDELRDLPFTTKEDLRAHYPLGMMAVPDDQLARLHSSSGTSGKPTIVGHTRHDLDVWAELMARCLVAAGVRPGMVVHNGYPYGLTTGGFGFQQGAERLGATVVPAAGAPVALQATLLRDLGAQILCCSPSFAAQLATEGCGDSLAVGIFGGEMWTPALRDRLEASLGLAALNTYGLSEVIGPGVASECLEGRAGAHVSEDHFLAEVIDPVTTEPLAPGQLGELVITTLTREAMPLVRYRTGDIASLSYERCACGRTTARMSSVLGRRADVLDVRGVRFYPSQVERALLAQPGVGLAYQLVVGHGDVDLHCEPVDAFADRGALGEQVRAALREQLGLDMRVIVEAPGGVPRSPGKAVRVVVQ